MCCAGQTDNAETVCLRHHRSCHMGGMVRVRKNPLLGLLLPSHYRQLRGSSAEGQGICNVWMAIYLTIQQKDVDGAGAARRACRIAQENRRKVSFHADRYTFIAVELLNNRLGKP